jgi:hypothetical protein
MLIRHLAALGSNQVQHVLLTVHRKKSCLSCCRSQSYIFHISDVFKTMSDDGTHNTLPSNIKSFILRGGHVRSWARQNRPEATSFCEDAFARSSQVCMKECKTINS